MKIRLLSLEEIPELLIYTSGLLSGLFCALKGSTAVFSHLFAILPLFKSVIDDGILYASTASGNNNVISNYIN